MQKFNIRITTPLDYGKNEVVDKIPFWDLPNWRTIQWGKDTIGVFKLDHKKQVVLEQISYYTYTYVVDLCVSNYMQNINYDRSYSNRITDLKFKKIESPDRLYNQYNDLGDGYYTTLMYKEEEIQLVKELMHAYGHEQLKLVGKVFDDRDHWLREPGILLWHKTEEGDKLIGYQLITVNTVKYPDITKSYTILLDPNYRGKKLAQKLFGEVCAIANYLQSYNMLIYADLENDGAKFYQKIGLPYVIKENEFGSKDAVFEVNVKGVYSTKDFHKFEKVYEAQGIFKTW